MIFKPHNYQSDCIQWLHEHPRSGIFADPGLGKTAMVLHYLDDVRWFQPDFKALVIAPLRVIYLVWPPEIRKWGLPFTYSILHDKHKEQAARENTQIHLINVESLFWHFDDLPRYTHLIIDESSKFKSSKAKRTKLLIENLDSFPNRVLLTGTPSPNSLEDLYSQIHILDKGKALGKNVTAFRSRFFYCTKVRKFMEWNPVAGADDSIRKLIQPLVNRIDAEANLDLPPLVKNTLHIDLPAKTQKLYDDLEKKLFAELDGAKLVLASASSAYNVCRQLANGRFYEPPPPLSRVASLKNRRVISAHGLKIEALRELLGELQGKSVLVAYHFKHDLAQLLEAFGSDTPVLGGKTTAKRSEKIVNQWNAGKIPLLLGHPQSIGHGLNLQQGGRDIVWFSLTDNLENYIQFNRRIHRQGAPGQTRVHHLIVRKTVDEAVMRRLKNKDKNQRSLLDALKQYRKEKS